MADFSDTFEVGLGDWGIEADPQGRLNLSTDQAWDGVQSVKVQIAQDNDLAFIKKTDVPNWDGDFNRWHYSRFYVYLDFSWATLWDGGNQWGAFMGGASIDNSAVVYAGITVAGFYATSPTEGKVFLAGTEVLANTGEWIDIGYGINVNSNGTHYQWEFYIGGVLQGSGTCAFCGAFANGPNSVVLGDPTSGDPSSPSYQFYIDAATFQVDTLPDALPGGGGGGGPTCADFGRFYEAPPWRGIVTNLNSETLTFLDRLADDINITPILNAPHTSSARVPSDNPEIYILADEGSDSDPFLAEGTRLVYWFRRDCTLSNGNPEAVDTPWVIREAGIILDLEDSGDSDAPDSVFTAYSPWEYLRSVPCLKDPGVMPDQNGILYAANTRWDEIVIDQLTLMAIAQVGDPLQNAALDWGQTVYYNGTIEATQATVDAYVIQQGRSIGDLFDDLVSTGEIDIIETPVYDPVNRPGITHELSIYQRAGDDQYNAIFSWDMFPRSCAGINRVTDGRERTNRVRYHAGQGGPTGGTRTDAASVAKYGNYLREQFFPGIDSLGAAYIMSGRTLALQADGLFTYKLAPSTSRSPISFVDYNVGDFVPVYASRNLREPIDGLLLRVQSIPIQVNATQLEHIDGLLVSSEVPIGS